MSVPAVPTGPFPPGDLDSPALVPDPPPEGWDVFMTNVRAAMDAILAASPAETGPAQ